jgi:hypothetical protein
MCVSIQIQPAAETSSRSGGQAELLMCELRKAGEWTPAAKAFGEHEKADAEDRQRTAGGFRSGSGCGWLHHELEAAV